MSLVLFVSNEAPPRKRKESKKNLTNNLLLLHCGNKERSKTAAIFLSLIFFGLKDSGVFCPCIRYKKIN